MTCKELKLNLCIYCRMEAETLCYVDRLAIMFARCDTEIALKKFIIYYLKPRFSTAPTAEHVLAAIDQQEPLYSDWARKIQVLL